MSLGLWPWAVAAYARPEVSAACLELQDSHGHCAPYLLWAAWTAQCGREVGEDGWRPAAALARSWEAEVTGHLRQVRRGLKAPRTCVDDIGRERLRAEVKTVELAAERLLLDSLEALTPLAAAPACPPVLTARLRQASRAYGRAAPERLLDQLAVALSADAVESPDKLL